MNRWYRLALFLLLVSGMALLSGCLTTDVNSQPVASFTFSPASSSAPATITFDASTSYDPDGSIASYQWQFGSGSGSAGKVTHHTFDSAGYYTVTLVVTDNRGATASTSHGVTISAGAKLQILDYQLQPYDNMFMPWVIVGHAKNVSGKMLSYASVNGQFYDSGGVLLSDWLDNTSDLAPGVTWEFRIHCMESDIADRVDHATVTVGTCLF